LDNEILKQEILDRYFSIQKPEVYKDERPVLAKNEDGNLDIDKLAEVCNK